MVINSSLSTSNRTVEDIQQEFFQMLAQYNTKLTAIAPGDNLYTLARAIAAMHADQDIRLDEVKKSLTIGTSVGIDLEKRAADFNISRRVSKPAKGFVLALSETNAVSIPPNFVLTDPSTGQQYFVNSPTSISVVPFIETRLPLLATRAGEQGNTLAGTRLISPLASSVRFVVGSHRTTGGVACSDLIGGRSAETDVELARRLIDSLSSSRVGSTSAIERRFLEEPNINYVIVSSPLPGAIQVWVDSTEEELTGSEINRLKEIGNSIKPAGTLSVSVQALQKQYIDVNILVTLTQGGDLDEVTKQIRGAASSFFNSLKVGQSFISSNFTSSIAALERVAYAELLSPLEKRIEPVDLFTLLRARNILVTYNA